MKSLLLKKALYIGSYLLAAIIIELITFNIIGLGVFPTYFWLDLAILFFIGAVLFIVPNFIAQAILICLLLLIQVLLAVVNEALYSMSNMIFNLNMLNLAKEVGGVFNNDFVNYFLGVGLLLIAIAEGIFLWVLRKYKAKHTFKWQVLILVLTVFCLSSGLSSVLYFVSVDSFTTAAEADELFIYKDDTYLYDTQFIGTKAYKKFGTFGFYYKNIENFLNKDSQKVNISESEARDAISTYLSEGNYSSDLDDVNLTSYGGSDSLMTGKLNGQNIVLIVIESGEWYAINGEYTPTLYSLATQGIAMTQYFARDKTNHSEAMSILGSYPARNDNTILSSLGNPDGMLDHSFDFSLPNILQEIDYTTNYFHANDGDYYGRNQTFGELYGFDHAQFLDTMERLEGYYNKKDFYDYDKDSEVISQYFNDFTRIDVNDQNYFTMMMTLISHGHYDDLLNYGDYSAALTEKEKNAFSKKYVVKGLENYFERINAYPETYVDEAHSIYLSETNENGKLTDAYLRYKRYQAGMMDLDVGVNRLIHQLEEKGELENTSFVFYADHNAYYNQQSYLMREISSEEYWNTSLYNVPFFIWSGNCMSLNVNSDLYNGLVYENNCEQFQSAYGGAFYHAINYRCGAENLGGLKIEKFCNSFDLLPTLLDLLGYDYNLHLYQGVSVFQDTESVFVSRESGMFTANMYSDGEKIFIKTRPRTSENEPLYSYNGEICFSKDSVSIRINGKTVELSIAAAEKYLYVYKSQDFIIYDLDYMLSDSIDEAGVLDYRVYLSDSAYAFLQSTNEYFRKQEMLELIYQYDYFDSASIDEYVFKTGSK